MAHPSQELGTPPAPGMRLPWGRWRLTGVAVLAMTTAMLCGMATRALAQAQVSAQGAAPALDPQLAQDAQQLLTQAVQGLRLGAVRIDVQVGAMDPRLNLAPCARAETYLPPGTRPLGRTRVGLRCVQGPTRWNITLPVTVAVFAPGVVTRQALPMGVVLSDEHLTLAEVNWAADGGRVHADPQVLLGRELTRPLAAGVAVSSQDLKQRQWFAAGDMVQVRAVGAGFAISTDGTALNPGLEGQTVRVRTGNGRVVSGRATAERLVEVSL